VLGTQTQTRLTNAPAHSLPPRTSGTQQLRPRADAYSTVPVSLTESQTQTVSARVLVVEPVPVLRTIMTRALAARGYSVTAVGTLNEMLRLLTTFDPHVIVSELVLPDGAGDVACKRLKARPDKLRPVVLISGLPENELARRAMHVSADRYHCKSRGLSELVELVDEMTSEIVF
jgi:CheY-like chemotaxis protein